MGFLKDLGRVALGVATGGLSEVAGVGEAITGGDVAPANKDEAEKNLFDQQKRSLEVATDIMEKQYGLSEKDRSYFDRIFRGEVDPTEPKIVSAVNTALQKAYDEQGDFDKPMSEAEFMAQFDTKELSDADWVKMAYSAGAGRADVSQDDPEGYRYWQDRLASGESRDSVSRDMQKATVQGGAEWDADWDKADSAKNKEAYSAYKTSNALLSGVDEDSVRQQILDSFSTGQSVDELLFDAVKASKSDLATALTSYADKSAAITQQYGADRSGIASKYTDRINDLASTFDTKMEFASDEFVSSSIDALGTFNEKTNEYQGALERVSQEASSKLGTADTDILAQQRGQQLSGISQAYSEAQNELLGTLGRRGLAGSGIEASSLARMSNQEALAKAGALSQSYNQAIGLSDQRRMQQVGLQGDVSQMGIGVAGQQLASQQQVGQGIYGTRAQTAESQYQAGSQAAQAGYQTGMTNVVAQEQAAQQLAAQQYQGQTAGTQQNIANLQTASGVSQGIYGGATNLLAGAGATAGQIASTAGSTALGIGNQAVQLQAQAAEKEGALMGGLISGASSGLTAAFLSSDERLKTNIQPTGDVVNGFNIYTWDWNDTFHELGYKDTYNEGVLAQEVLEIMPDAVVKNNDGYYMVNYNKIGV